MITQENVGYTIRYWKVTGKGTGWHTGILKRIEEETTAIIHHSVLRRDQKAHVSNCEPYEGEAMSQTIFDHLFRVAQVAGVKKQQPGESDQDYLRTILRAVHSADDQLWNSIPIPAQQWFNEAATAVSTANPVPPCPGFIGLDEVQKVTEMSEPPKGLTAKEALNTPRPQAPTSSKAKRQVTGVMEALRKTVIMHPEWTSRQLYDYLKLNGFPNAKLDTISVDGGNIRRVIEIAKELGYWNDKGNANGAEEAVEVSVSAEADKSEVANTEAAPADDKQVVTTHQS